MNRPRAVGAACGLLLLLGTTTVLGAPASPDWGQLDAHTQAVLAPLSGEWNRFAPQHKQQLLALVPHYDRLPVPAQQRVSARLKAWADLPQEQQVLARQHWLALQAMSPERRQDVLNRMVLRRSALVPD